MELDQRCAVFGSVGKQGEGSLVPEDRFEDRAEFRIAEEEPACKVFLVGQYQLEGVDKDSVFIEHGYGRCLGQWPSVFVVDGLVVAGRLKVQTDQKIVAFRVYGGVAGGA